MREDLYGLKEQLVDDYERQDFYKVEELEAEVRDMEANSEWVRQYESSEFKLEPLMPIDVWTKAQQYGWSEALTMETAQEKVGSQLYLTAYNSAYLVRNCAKGSLMETAKLFGSALGRMSPAAYAETLNCGFDVANGTSMMLLRYGKVAALHSEGAGGYEIMPISTLLDCTVKELEDRFGDVRFIGGYNSHEYTEARFELEDAKAYLVAVYEQALMDAGSKSAYNIDFTPVVRFCSSDTSNACATLQPLFSMGPNRDIRICDGVKVKHSKKGLADGKSGVEIYKEEISTIYAKFENSANAIRRLAGITVYHPDNVVVGLCRKFGIPKKYGTAAYEEIEMYRGGEGCSMIAHDVYLAMTAALESAKDKEASRLVINGIDEALAKIAQIEDWSEFDVAGVVAWKD